ncbi:hypothetical protein ACFLIM_47795 [Nonomuraea sp. M3C6]|uniref:ABC transporter permease n=1 Tax=Nonomuraea marmarensis TaxID=3351344 RepID=A0ABW7AWZ5_9ACTN
MTTQPAVYDATLQGLYDAGRRDVMLAAGAAVLAGAPLLTLRFGWRAARRHSSD